MIIPELPEREYFYIGDVSELLNIKPHILRYWEKEFFFLRPRKNNTGHRLYTKKDIQIIARIFELLNNEKYTVEGSRKKLTLELRHEPFSILEKNADKEKINRTL